MVQVVYVHASGEREVVDVAEGETVMRGAVENGVSGIEAMCGGACSCATCHVYIDGAWIERLDPPHEPETDMLELVEDPRPASRLCCQIQVSSELDGLIVHIPESQS
jgi:2Fe-2S ferredoxin